MALKNGHTSVSTELIVQGSVHPSGSAVQVTAGGVSYSSGSVVSQNIQTSASGGNETRPKNAYINYIIKI